MKLNFKIILSILGLLLVINGLFMLLCVPVSLYYGDGDAAAIGLSSMLSIVAGVLLYLPGRGSGRKDLRKRDGYLIVTAGWLTAALSGTLPYLISGAIPFFPDAFFEAMAGYTTTGSSVLENIEQQPHGILLWRSVTQWIGGMGIIVLTVAVLPFLGIGGMQLFVAESPGISPDKFTPRINETAKRMWWIYMGLTATQALLLLVGGMDIFDAVNHSLTTVSTGGFSTRQDSVGAFTSPFIQYVIILFMILGATNFTIIYLGLNGRIRKALQHDELWYFAAAVVLWTVLISLGLIVGEYYPTFEESIRTGLFQVVSVATTTGYATADFELWPGYESLLFLLLMFLGGSAGSTAGGIKIVRHVILFKSSYMELKRLAHPSAVIPVHFNKRAVTQSVSAHVVAFVMLYILTFAFGSFVLSLMGLDFASAIGAAATALGNIGPGLGSVGPSATFAHLPVAAKAFLSFLMLLGRLELFTVLILFTPFFWSKS